MREIEIELRYSTGVPNGYLDDFRRPFSDGRVRLSVQEFEPRPHAALEWVIPTAVAVYIAKPFLDAIIKRAADDFGDSVYPRIKGAIVDLARKLYIRQPPPSFVITNQGPKVPSADMVFSICSETTTAHSIKFVFLKTYSDEQYDACVEQIFKILAKHHASIDGSDHLSRQIAVLPENRRGHIYLAFDDDSGAWIVRDPIQEAVNRKRESRHGSQRP